MQDKPRDISGYPPEAAAMARRACLSLATILGELLDDIVVVGGLVPSLLAPGNEDEGGLGAHAGTMDLDVGLSIGMLEEGRYREIHRRLRDAGFHPDRSPRGEPVHQRWVAGDLGITIVFLIPPSGLDDQPGRLRHLEENFAAILTPGLDLAFLEPVSVSLEGTTHRGDAAERSIRVCDAGPFVVLKALAVRNRDATKDAYDLYYILLQYPGGIDEIAAQMKKIQDHPKVGEAVEALESDFVTPNHIGPRRVAEFLGDRDDPVVLQDVVGYVMRLLKEFKA